MQKTGQAIVAVDLDGTLLRGDTFLTMVARSSWRDPVMFFRRMMIGLAGLKAWMYSLPLSKNGWDSWVWNEPLIQWLAERKRQGVWVVLVSAAPESFLLQVQQRMPELIDEVIGSSGTLNLRGRAKADALVARWGRQGFDYVGNSQADMPVWAVARVAYNVNPSRGLRAWAKREGIVLEMIAHNPQVWVMEAWDVFKRATRRSS